MKILFVINNLGVGGAQKMVRYVYNEMSSSVESCKLVALYSRDFVESTETTIQLCKTGESYFKVLLLLRQLIKRDVPDILCAFGSDSVSVSYFATRGLGVKLIGSERNDPSHLPKKWRIITKYVYPRCDGFSFQLRGAMDYYKMKESSKVVIIPNAYLGKHYTEFILAKERSKTVACVSARIDRQKGVDILLKAFVHVHKKHPEYNLEIYGKVNQWKELNEMIDSLGLSACVVFKGQTDCLSDAIHYSRCFVLPSRFEGIPNALIEAMASGVPCVATDCPPGGPRMLTEEGQSGLLCRVEDSVDLSNQICRILEDDTLCDELSERAQAVQIRFDSFVVSKKWITLFNIIN